MSLLVHIIRRRGRGDHAVQSDLQELRAQTRKDRHGGRVIRSARDRVRPHPCNDRRQRLSKQSLHPCLV